MNVRQERKERIREEIIIREIIKSEMLMSILLDIHRGDLKLDIYDFL